MSKRRNQAEELTRAANQITDAVKELTAVMGMFLEHQQAPEYWQRRPNKQLESVWVGMPEEEAVNLALSTAHEVRESMGRGIEVESEEKHPTPSTEDVRKRREDRRKRESEDRS